MRANIGNLIYWYFFSKLTASVYWGLTGYFLFSHIIICILKKNLHFFVYLYSFLGFGWWSYDKLCFMFPFFSVYSFLFYAKFSFLGFGSFCKWLRFLYKQMFLWNMTKLCQLLFNFSIILTFSIVSQITGFRDIDHPILIKHYNLFYLRLPSLHVL